MPDAVPSQISMDGIFNDIQTNEAVATEHERERNAKEISISNRDSKSNEANAVKKC